MSNFIVHVMCELVTPSFSTRCIVVWTIVVAHVRISHCH